MKTLRLFALALVLSSLPFSLPARIISYAPVTDRHATPAVQHRMNRHYALIESDTPFFFPGPLPGVPPPLTRRGRLVLYDSKGESEPRVILPKTGGEVSISMAAVWEGPEEKPRVLVGTDADLGGDNPSRLHRFLYSGDAGETWKAVATPAGFGIADGFYEDTGGPFVRTRGAQVRIGSRDFPFVLSSGGLYAVASDGSARSLGGSGRLIGSDAQGTRFLVMGGTLAPDAVRVVDLDGRLGPVIESVPASTQLEGWITPEGSVYLEKLQTGARSLTFYRDGARFPVATPLPGAPISELTLLAIPTWDYWGAWIVQRGTALPTVLSRHFPGGTAVEQWRDISGPEVEAVHAGASGRKLLIQVHRPRPQADQRIFRDPALAVWQVGEPAPPRYDELFLNEGRLKAFVHLDVEAIAGGEPFVFDSAATPTFFPGPLPSPAPPAPGGGDVTQEWGVVRASLKQKLVLPVAARVAGAYGSFWRTDLVLRNPSEREIELRIRYAPSFPAGAEAREVLLSLRPDEVRILSDVLLSLFAVESGSGALFLTPEADAAVSLTSRTYTTSARGSFGMGVGAVEFLNRASARFPLTFSGALQGSNFRTNLVVTDAAGRGGEILLRAAGSSGLTGRSDFAVILPPGGQSQIGGLGQMLQVEPHQTGALLFSPKSGEAIPALIAVDNRTNDPTYFPPDLPSPYVRTIPAIVHEDGAHGSAWRTDLFLFNPSAQFRSVTLAVRRWNEPENETVVNLNLLPYESKTIRDVLLSAFGRAGVARLRYVSGGAADTTGVRVTSRTYTSDSSGGTYGFLMPPLNSFQAAGPGESLEILGPLGDKDFRTNLALVDLTAFPGGPAPRVKIEISDEKGAIVDSFETSVPSAGGVQFGDLFRARGLGSGPAAAVIRISPYGGLIGAFATMTDNGTNDPVYFAAGLASK